jgi:hypothetical protein
MTQEREHKIRERAYRLWEQDGRPEGQEQAHWREAERQIVAEEGEAWRPDGPDATAAGSPVAAPPADPLRNPELVPPAEDLEYPAVTGPEAVPEIEGARTSLNPAEIVEEPQPTPHPGAAAGTGTRGVKKKGGTSVKLRQRPGKSTLEP